MFSQNHAFLQSTFGQEDLTQMKRNCYILQQLPNPFNVECDNDAAEVEKLEKSMKILRSKKIEEKHRQPISNGNNQQQVIDNIMKDRRSQRSCEIIDDLKANPSTIEESDASNHSCTHKYHIDLATYYL